MSKYFKNRFYPQNFYMIVNDRTDIDAVMNELSEDAGKLAPDSFDAEVTYFPFYFRYQPPYVSVSDFRELKYLQRKAISKTRFKSEYNGYILINISEWIGHTEEEHFTNSMYFLRDMNDHWKYVFLLNSPDGSYELEKAVEDLKKVIWVSEILPQEQSEKSFPEQLIEEAEKVHKFSFLPESKQLLVKSLSKMNPVSVRRTIETAIYDLESYVGKQVTYEALTEYLLDSSTYMHDIMTEEEISNVKAFMSEKEINL